MTNKIISIGYLGNKRCYLNVPREEAVRRYIESEGSDAGSDPGRIDEIEVTDEWCSYDGASPP